MIVVVGSFVALYPCTTMIRECLLSIQIRDNSGESQLERREGIVVGAAIGLVLYTLILSMIGPSMSSAAANKTISNTGSVKAIGVGVYWDQATTNAVSSINWGTLDPGSIKNVTVYIKNTGNAPARLLLTTSNWSPSNASSYMVLSWNYGGQTLSAGEVMKVILTLSVSTNITGIASFSFDITITSEG